MAEQQTVYQTLYGTVFSTTFSAPSASGAELAWDHLTVKSKRGDVRLLRDVCGKVSGRLLAVMGPSGSGKTTFLNQLSMRATGMEVESGSLTVQGKRYDAGDIKRISGYVMQDDILFAKLTVFETLQYAARLKMHPNATPADRTRRINKMLKIMGLTKCRDVVVGSPFVTGISGGQRKRLAVSVELLSRPHILFLGEHTATWPLGAHPTLRWYAPTGVVCWLLTRKSEPTSGLDSVSAYALVETLRGLAHKEKVTV